MKCVFVGLSWFSLLQAVEATKNLDKDNKELSEQMISEDANLTFWTGVFDLTCKRHDREFPYMGTGKKYISHKNHTICPHKNVLEVPALSASYSRYLLATTLTSMYL